MTISQASNTVTFDVGGHVYRVSRTLLELHPKTMLARTVSKEVQSTTVETYFIDRNGTRFQYVLDWMRDQEVNLPVTESFAAFRRELEYFGFDTTKLESCVTVGTMVETREVAAAVSGNYHAEMDAVHQAIRNLEKRKKELKDQMGLMKAAHMLFGRSSIQGASVGGTFHIKLASKDDKVTAYFAVINPTGLNECLARYGLKYVQSSDLSFDDAYSDKIGTVELKKIKTSADGTGAVFTTASTAGPSV